MVHRVEDRKAVAVVIVTEFKVADIRHCCLYCQVFKTIIQANIVIVKYIKLELEGQGAYSN